MTVRVTLAYAQTLDGQMAAVDGSSRWISGSESLVQTHRLRADHDAIMVGIGTVLVDNPQLTVRLCPGRNPTRIIIDSTLRTPLHAHVVQSARDVPTWIMHAPDASEAARVALQACGVQCVGVPRTPQGGLDIDQVLQQVAELGVSSVMVEGGRQLMTSLLRARRVTRLVVTIAPKLVGSGIAALGDIGVTTMAEAYTIPHPQIAIHGADVWVDGLVQYD